jgi:hypothetical protein
MATVKTSEAEEEGVVAQMAGGSVWCFEQLGPIDVLFVSGLSTPNSNSAAVRRSSTKLRRRTTWTKRSCFSPLAYDATSPSPLFLVPAAVDVEP